MPQDRLIINEIFFSVQGESETFDLKEVWILAPNIGKLRIALMDEFFNNQRGWMDLTGGNVGGQDILDIITDFRSRGCFLSNTFLNYFSFFILYKVCKFIIPIKPPHKIARIEINPASP